MSDKHMLREAAKKLGYARATLIYLESQVEEQRTKVATLEDVVEGLGEL